MASGVDPDSTHGRLGQAAIHRVYHSRMVEVLASMGADLDRADRLRLEESADLLGRVLRGSAWEPVEPGE